MPGRSTSACGASGCSRRSSSPNGASRRSSRPSSKRRALKRSPRRGGRWLRGPERCSAALRAQRRLSTAHDRGRDQRPSPGEALPTPAELGQGLMVSRSETHSASEALRPLFSPVCQLTQSDERSELSSRVPCRRAPRDAGDGQHREHVGGTLQSAGMTVVVTTRSARSREACSSYLVSTSGLSGAPAREAMAEDEPASGYRPPGGSDRDSFPGSLPLPATGQEVGQFVAHRAAACVGAEYSNLAVLNAATGLLAAVPRHLPEAGNRRSVHGRSS